MNKKLYRSNDNKIIFGIAGGIGEYLNIDTTVIRVIWIFSTAFLGFSILAYILLLFVIPEKPKYWD